MLSLEAKTKLFTPKKGSARLVTVVDHIAKEQEKETHRSNEIHMLLFFYIYTPTSHVMYSKPYVKLV
ncbi:MAG TPA: hypothetical protein VE619_05110 [Nitrososphaeraceae archaeon]|nr:hypothetical protein [Nitrososphaeraceae archaeon]